MHLSGRRPHDAFFTAYFSRPAAFAQLLEFTLPAEVYSMLDLSNFSIDTGSYIDEYLRRHFSDLAATVRLTANESQGTAHTPLSAPARDTHTSQNQASAGPAAQGGAGGANVYVLVEHKSYKDSAALLQILRYMVRIWSEQQKSVPGSPLTPIIPILIYHGRSKKVNAQFASLFDDNLSETLARYQPRFMSELLNLTGMNEDELPVNPAPLSAGLWAMRYAQTELRESLAAMQRLFDTAEAAGIELEHDANFGILMEYLLRGSHGKTREIIDVVNEVLRTPLLREEAMTAAEQLRRQGLEEGLEKGRIEGRRQERETTALRLLERGFSPTEVAELTELSEDEVRGLTQRDEP